MTVTVRDVAERAGISRSTASIILSDHPHTQRYSAATRRQVLEAAEALGYQPNYFATRLRSGRSDLLTLCTHRISASFAAQIAETFSEVAVANGYRVMILPLDPLDNPVEVLDTMRATRQCNAIAVVGQNTFHELPEAGLRDMAKRGMELVLINRLVEDPRIPCVDADEVPGVRQVLAHFRERGVSSFAVVRGRDQDPTSRLASRLELIRHTASEMGFPDPAVVCSPTPVEDDPSLGAVEGSEAGRALLRDQPDTQAVFALTDPLAIGVVKAAADMSVRIGRHLRVVGFDDQPFSQFAPLPLSSVRLPLREMATAAADMLIGRMHDKAPTQRVQRFPTEFIARATG